MANEARLRVLIVEDEPDMNNLLADVLQAFGYDPIQAGSGEQALEILADDRPDAILLDLMLPGISGFELCKQLKGARETRTIPIVILTALDRGIDRRYGFETGADEYMTKPFTPDGLVSRLQACLDRCRDALEECGHLLVTLELTATLTDLKAFNSLVTCLYCHTDFSPQQIEALRQGLVRLSDAAGEWMSQHRSLPPVRLTMDLNAEHLRLVFQPAADGAADFLAQHLSPEAAVPSSFTDAGVIDQMAREDGVVILSKALPPCGCK